MRPYSPSSADNDETFQSYSSFTTNYKPPDQYEALLVKASKSRAQAVKIYQRREANEAALVHYHFMAPIAFTYIFPGECE